MKRRPWFLRGLWLPAVALALLAVIPPAAIPLAAGADVPGDVLKAEAERVKVLEKARAATVAIFAAGGRGGGSGVVVSREGYALTNYHVSSGAGDAMKCGMADGTLYDAVIVGIDPTGDVALIKLLGKDEFPYAEMGNSDRVRQGDVCFACGNPFLLANDFKPTVTYGIVSGTHRYQYPAGTLLEYADCIQADAAINPGNSGGPLFNADGQVIGINGRGSFEKRARVNVGVGYAISINQIKNFMGCLKGGRLVDHATTGFQVLTGDDGKVIVNDILTSSDAYRRGLRYGDELVAFGGRRIDHTNAFKNVLGIYPKGWRVPMTYEREGKEYDALVRLAGVHKTGELEEKILKQNQPRPGQPRPGQPRPGQPRPGQPRPGDPDQPKPRDDPDKQPPDPENPVGPRPAQRPMPEIVKQHYEKRDGYVNYHFNKLEQQRVWKLLQSRGDFSGVAGKWTVVAEAAGNLESTFEFTDLEFTATLPGGKATIPIDDENPQLAQNLDPVGSGGMFSALVLWRRFLLSGVDKFGGMHYYGEAPIPGYAGLADCLVGVYGGVECRFYVDPREGNLLLLEMYSGEEADPCEIYFGDYVPVQGRQLPRRMEVRFGSGLYQVYKVTGYTLTKGEEPSGGTKPAGT
ncbi:MAG: trypsin-like peptidase domain-containing protein [Planctomycetia bacterium]|nr:trypsin-like peptidase domain-containing protein [Planctomycetia bacterium]